MPDKETLERAREDAREGKSPSTQAGEFVREEMHHIREGNTELPPPSRPSQSACQRRGGRALSWRHPRLRLRQAPRSKRRATPVRLSLDLRLTLRALAPGRSAARLSAKVIAQHRTRHYRDRRRMQPVSEARGLASSRRCERHEPDREARPDRR